MPTGHVQVLGGGAADGGNALLVFFDERRYLVGCGEGTQRFCCHHHVRLGKLAAIFLPRLEWICSGGLPGMICTVADSSAIPGLTLVGPKNTAHFIGTLRPFLRRGQFDLSLREVAPDLDAGPIFQDEFIKVSAFEIFGGPREEREGDENKTLSGSDSKRRKTPPMDASDPDQPTASTAFVKQMFKQSIEIATGENTHLRDDSPMPPAAFHGASLCYLFEGPETPGKFDAARAKTLGVPVGPLNGRLAKGESITVKVDGQERIVHPKDVVGPSAPGAQFAVLTVPTLAFAEDLRDKLPALLRMPRRPTMIFHCCPEAVFTAPFYQEHIVAALQQPGEGGGEDMQMQQIWMGGSGGRRHLPLIYPAPAKILADLSVAFAGEIFSLPYAVPAPPLAALPLSKYSLGGGGNPVDLTEAHALLAESAQIISTAVGHPNSPEHHAPPTPRDPIVTFLGTGAAMPGKYRNVSSTLIDFGDAAYLLDCGEATYGQLLRRFPPPELQGLLGRLRAVLISHLHADHQLGLPGLLLRTGRVGRRLAILAPQRYRLFLEELGECAELGGPYDFYGSERVETDAEYAAQVASALGLATIAAIPAIHCPHAYGFVLQHPGGIKLAFSGDTRPCPALAEAGRGADILIHEASFCDALQAEAIDKRHSTLSEAIDIGRRMEARFTLLNHISQRYAKTLPPYEWRTTQSAVLPTIDLMSVRLSQLQRWDLVDLIETMLQHMPREGDQADAHKD